MQPSLSSRQPKASARPFLSPGIGLGLAICRMIVERHGGQLSAASDGNNGAQFQFVLPTMYSDATPANSEIDRLDFRLEHVVATATVARTVSTFI